MRRASSLDVVILLRRTSGRARAWLFAVLALGVSGRLLVVITAVFVARERPMAATFAGIASASIFALLRVAQVFARIRVQRDIYSRTADAVLATDVLAVPTADVRRVVLDGTYHSVLIVAALVPALVADAIASIAIAPFIVMMFSPRVLVLVGIAVPTVTIATIAVRGVTRRLEQRAMDAWDRVIERLLVAVENRLELVARAGEGEFHEGFERQLDEYEWVTRRSNLATALLARVPLVAGALAVGLVVTIDNVSRQALAGAVLSQALILAACFPAIHGLFLGLHGMVRSLVFGRSLITVLSAPPRKDVTEPGRLVLELPAEVRGEAVSFAYDERTVISALSFAWSNSEPLVLVGRNGSGKSTLLKLLLGLRPLGSGSIRYASHALADVNVRALRREVAYLPQRPYLGESYSSVRDAMRLSVPRASDDALREVLARADVLAALAENTEGELETKVGQLSAGQRQRVAIARVLLQDARIVLLDEPDANLDREGIALVARLVRELCARGTMVAVAAHTQELAELSSRPVELV